ncbi:MAG: hypothetical protein P8K08_13425 [Fuerstiella sp.]|nr:hypothetical protein [Fuerstiella sp.]
MPTENGISSAYHEDEIMARWPDNKKSNVVMLALIFLLFPLLAWLCAWFVNG